QPESCIEVDAAAARVEPGESFGEQDRDVERIQGVSVLDPALGEGLKVVVRERLVRESLLEPLPVPDLEMVALCRNDHFARHAGAFAQQRLNQQATLAVEAKLGAEVADPLEEPLAHRIGRGQRRKLGLDLFPDGERIDERLLSRHRGDEKVRAPPLLEGATEIRRDLESALVVDGRKCASAQHSGCLEKPQVEWRECSRSAHFCPFFSATLLSQSASWHAPGGTAAVIPDSGAV